MRHDHAVSDIVGTIMLLAVAVSFASAAALSLNSGDIPQQPLRLELTSSVRGNNIELMHLGGSSLVLGEMRMIVRTQDTIHFDAMGTPADQEWEIGEIVTLGLPGPLPPGSYEVAVVHLARGETVGIAGGAVPPGAPASGGPTFTVDVILDGSTAPPTVTAPSQVLAEATVSHAEGRKLLDEVYADLSNIDGPTWFSLRDDGTRGDRAAGDSVYTGVLNVPVSVTPGQKTIRVYAIDLHGSIVHDDATLTVV